MAEVQLKNIKKVYPIGDTGKKQRKFLRKAKNENPETNKVTWKSVGVVKVDKKQIWDNRYSLTEEGKQPEGEAGLKGTVLSANKKAAVGMVVKQVIKKK